MLAAIKGAGAREVKYCDMTPEGGELGGDVVGEEVGDMIEEDGPLLCTTRGDERLRLPVAKREDVKEEFPYEKEGELYGPYAGEEGRGGSSTGSSTRSSSSFLLFSALAFAVASSRISAASV